MLRLMSSQASVCGLPSRWVSPRHTRERSFAPPPRTVATFAYMRYVPIGTCGGHGIPHLVRPKPHIRGPKEPASRAGNSGGRL